MRKLLLLAVLGFASPVLAQTGGQVTTIPTAQSQLVSFTAGAGSSVWPCDATAGAIIATLPSAVTNKARHYFFLKTDASANTVTVTPAGGQTINGAATIVLSLQGQAVEIVSDGTVTWRRLSITWSGTNDAFAWHQSGDAFGALGVIGTTDAQAFSVLTSGVERARFLSTGAALFGATTAVGAERFRVAGTALVDTNSTTAFSVKTGGGALAATVLAVDTVNSRVGVGTVPGAYTLDVLGTLHVTGKVTFDSILDPTALILSAPGYIEFPDGSALGAAPANKAWLSYNNTTKMLQTSTDAGSERSLVTVPTGPAPTNGQVPIGNGTAFVLNTLTAGSGILITNAPGSITIASIGTTTAALTMQDVYNNSTLGAIVNLSSVGGPLTINNNIQAFFAMSLNCGGISMSCSNSLNGSKKGPMIQIEPHYDPGSGGYDYPPQGSGGHTVSPSSLRWQLSQLEGPWRDIVSTTTLPAPGSLLIGNGLEFNAALLTAGSGISAVVGSGSLTVTATTTMQQAYTNGSGSGGVVALTFAGGSVAITNPAASAQPALTVTQNTAGQNAIVTAGPITSPGAGLSSERFGDGAVAAGAGGTAFGAAASAAHASTIVLGAGAASTAANQFIGGSPGAKTTDIYFGAGPQDEIPVAVKFRGTKASVNGSSGGQITIAGGLSNQNSDAGGDVRLAVAIVNSASSTTLTDCLTVDSATGYVGIGTTSPTKALHVVGDMKVTGTIDPVALELSGSMALYIDSTDGSGAAVAPSAHGRLRYLNGTGWQVSASGGAYATLVTGSAGTTLDGAYDFGGAGAGRSIDAAAGAVQIADNASDNNNVLELTKDAVGAQSGSALSITMGSAMTGPAITISKDSSVIVTAIQGVLDQTVYFRALGTGQIALKSAAGGVDLEANDTLSSTYLDINPGTGQILSTWNAAGVVHYGLIVDVTNTATAAGSRLLSAKVGGVEKFAVDSAGDTIVSGTLLSQRKVTAQATSIGITAAQSGSVITNEGAASKPVYTLPTAAAGLSYSFTVQDSDGMTITAAAGDTLRIAGSVTSAAGNLDSTTVGSTVTIVALNATEWVAVSSLGTWAVSP